MKKTTTKMMLSTMVLALGLSVAPMPNATQPTSWGAMQVEAASVVNYTTTANLNLRSTASTKGKLLVTIPKGKTVTYVSKSGTWFKVKYGSKTGYVSSTYLKKVVAKAPAKAPVKAPATPKAPAVTYKTVYSTTENLNLRAGASTSHKVLVSIPKGKTVTYVAKSGTWSKISYGGKTGFVNTKYLKTAKVAVASTPVVKPAPTPAKPPASPTPAPTPAPAPKPTPAPTPAKPDVNVQVVNYVTTDTLNMREGASVNHKVLVSIPKGKSVKYEATSGTWFKVTYAGKTGYVSSTYLKPGTSYFPAPPVASQGKHYQGVLVINGQNKLPSTYNPGMIASAKAAKERMFADAKMQGYSLRVTSDYRSYADQVALKAEYTLLYGKQYAADYVANPGYSEHQAGLAYDIGGTKAPFLTSKEFQWMQANGHKYGFHLRFMKGKEKITGCAYEPWHWRYLGSDLATTLKTSGKSLEEHLNIVKK